MNLYIHIYIYNSRKAASSHTPEKPTEFFDSLTLSLITQVGSVFYVNVIQYQNMLESICSFDTDNISIIHAKLDHIFNSK